MTSLQLFAVQQSSTKGHKTEAEQHDSVVSYYSKSFSSAGEFSALPQRNKKNIASVMASHSEKLHHKEQDSFIYNLTAEYEKGQKDI